MESNGSEARSALADVERVRGDLAGRLLAPRWYHLGVALSGGALLASFDLPPTPRLIAIVGFALALPAVLVGLARWCTGVDVRRMHLPRGDGAATRRAVRDQLLWAFVLVVLLGAGLTVESLFGIGWALVVAGVASLPGGYVVSVRLDREHAASVRDAP